MAFSLAELGQVLNAGAGVVNQYRQQRLLGDLGTKLQGGDFESAAQTALAAGDVGTGLELLKLGETRKQRDLQRQSDAEIMQTIGGLSGGVSSPAPSAQPLSSGSFGVPDTLWRAQIGQESGGNQFGDNGQPLTSPKGATGIAQVMPRTAPEAAQLAGVPFDPQRYKTDPAYNETLGRAYMGEQMRQFGDPVKALAAYNAGPQRVRDAIARGNENWLALMPAETRDYVRRISPRIGAADGQNQNVQIADASGAIPQSAGGAPGNGGDALQQRLDVLSGLLLKKGISPEARAAIQAQIQITNNKISRSDRQTDLEYRRQERIDNRTAKQEELALKRQEVEAKKAEGKPPTEQQSRANMIVQSAQRYNDILNDPNVLSAGLGPRAAVNELNSRVPIVGSFMTNEKYKQFKGAGEAFAQNILYLRSGQSAPAAEVEKTAREFTPQPGDGPERIAQLKQAREIALKGALEQAQRRIGAGATQPAAAPQGGPSVGAVEDGYRFKGGNPADPNSWERAQ